MSGGDSQESVISQATSDTAPLRVVKDVVGLHTELEAHTLANDKVLEERHVKVGAVRIVQAISRDGSKA